MTRSLQLGPEETSRAARWSRRLARFAVALALLGTLAHRAGLSAGLAGVAVLGLVVGVAMLAVVCGVIALVRIWVIGQYGTREAIVGTLLGVAVLAVPAVFLPAYLSRPALTQVSTDLSDPPRFQAALRDRRADSLNPEPLPEATRALQAQAYPTLTTLRLDLPATDAFDVVTEVVNARGWRVLASVPAELARPAQPARPATVVRGVRQPPTPAVAARPETIGRIEAVARTRIYGFLDDVVIRVRPVGPNETRIDMRSASRVGTHDLGANARRVEDFLVDVRDKAAER